MPSATTRSEIDNRIDRGRNRHEIANYFLEHRVKRVGNYINAAMIVIKLDKADHYGLSTFLTTFS